MQTESSIKEREQKEEEHENKYESRVSNSVTEKSEKIVEPLDISRVLEFKRVPEKEYKASILTDLEENIPRDNEAMILMLKEKLGSFDNNDTSQVFVYGKDNINEARKVIEEWVNHIDSKHYVLPSLVVEYFFSIVDESQFKKAVENPSLVADGNLRKAIEKYKSTIENVKS